MDTDGCIYTHDHINRGVRLINLGLTYTSHSRPLLNFAAHSLNTLGFTPKLRKNAVWLYREAEVIKYMQEIGSHNTHHQERLQAFLDTKYNSRRGV